MRPPLTIHSLAPHQRGVVALVAPPVWRGLVVDGPAVRRTSQVLGRESRRSLARDRVLLHGLRRLSIPAFAVVALLAGHGVGGLGERTVDVVAPAPTKQPIFAPAPMRSPEHVWPPAPRPAPRPAQ